MCLINFTLHHKVLKLANAPNTLKNMVDNAYYFIYINNAGVKTSKFS